ncbi:DUF58 domain-containing protein [Gaopeijia maritima]|uniref:DUF58 domain-containing protein n=1 Tax=Gaopeijia maritima TaxID=3119007 RepID=UPI00324AE614
MTHARARAGAPGAQFLDPRVLARIDNLELLARTVVDGFLNGLHRAPYLGLSMDFAEHRAYVPGDDTRHLDWRLFARTDRHYVKQYEAETNANVVALVDVSASMNYASDPEAVTKLDYARYLAACLLHFSRGQRDRVGLVTFDDRIRDYVPASARNLDRALHALARAEAGSPGDLHPALLTATERVGRKGIVAVISDFYEPIDRAMESLRLLRGRGHDLVVFRVMDPAELEFSFADPTNLEDLETGEQLPIVPKKLKAGYDQLVSDHVRTLEERCTAEQIDHVLLDTSQPLDMALFRYLTIREKKARRR